MARLELGSGHRFFASETYNFILGGLHHNRLQKLVAAESATSPQKVGLLADPKRSGCAD